MARARECGIDGGMKGGIQMNDDNNPIGRVISCPAAPLERAAAAWR